MSDKILVTGSAGFIGFHLSRKLLSEGKSVVGIDNLNDYYDVKLKEDRLAILEGYDNFSFSKLDLGIRDDLDRVFADEDMDSDTRIVHLAAQAGVRYSTQNPYSYINSNLVGFFNLLECSRIARVKHLVYASSSSVYGGNSKLPFTVHDNVDHPKSLYAATKKSNELLAHVYSYTYKLPTTGLRFFTVYGPWGRPDMSLFIFTRAILRGEAMPVYNNGEMSRDFTYVDDIIEGVRRIIYQEPSSSSAWDSHNPDPATSWAPYRIYNIGNNNSVNLLDFIKVIEDNLGKKAVIDFQPMAAGDVKDTFAAIDDIAEAVDFKPKTSIHEGIPRFLEWYKKYYGMN